MKRTSQSMVFLVENHNGYQKTIILGTPVIVAILIFTDIIANKQIESKEPDQKQDKCNQQTVFQQWL